MAKALPLLFLALAMSLPLFAQTTQTLPTTLVSFIQYTYPAPYANFNADDISAVINDEGFYVSINGHTDSTGACVFACSIQFWNLETGVQTNVPYSGTRTGQTVTGTFDQPPYVGSFTLDFVQKHPQPPCGRYGCRTYYVQQGSTLTLD